MSHIQLNQGFNILPIFPEETEIRNPKPSAQPDIPCIQELAPLPTIVKSTKGPADPPPRPLSVPSATETGNLSL